MVPLSFYLFLGSIVAVSLGARTAPPPLRGHDSELGIIVHPGEKRPDRFNHPEAAKFGRGQTPMECWNTTWTNNIDWTDYDEGVSMSAIGAGVWLYSAYYQRGPNVGSPFVTYIPKPTDPFYDDGKNRLVLRFRDGFELEPLLVNNMAFHINSFKIWPVNPEQGPVTLAISYRGYDESFGGSSSLVVGHDGQWGEIDWRRKIQENDPDGASDALSGAYYYVHVQVDGGDEFYLDDISTLNACEATRYYDVQECAPGCKREYIGIGESVP